MSGLAIFALMACEKEISVKLPTSESELVVEAYVNNRFPNLNYVFLSQTIDYFNPNLDLLGVDGADIYISEGDILGTDTIFDGSKRYQLIQSPIPGTPSGIYFSLELNPKEGKVYKLEIYYQGRTVTGTTTILPAAPILNHEFVYNDEKDGKRMGNLAITFQDPAEPAYYRIAYTVGRDSILLGFGGVDRIRNFDDEVRNGKPLTYDRFQPFTENDTVDVFLCRTGVKEYRFWQSFVTARNNDGPFATPVQLKSTLNGAIGCFTGLNIDHKRILIK